MAEAFDAVIFPVGWNPDPSRSSEEAGMEYLRRVLDSRGRLIHFREPHATTKYYFATLDPYDTELYPRGHPMARQPRYDWVERDGCKLGRLKPEAEC